MVACMTTDEVVIVGAGIAGLVTAHELHRQGIPSVVLEQRPYIGGRVQTVAFSDGTPCEAQLEEMWDTSPAYELLRRFGCRSSSTHRSRVRSWADGSTPR